MSDEPTVSEPGTIDNRQLQIWVVVACLGVVAYSLAIAMVRFFGSEGEPGSLRIAVSLVAPFVVAALVALLAQAAGEGRFVMAAAAGIIPAAAISLWVLPLWIPAIALGYLGWKQYGTVSTREYWSFLVVTGGIIAAMIALLVKRDPLEWNQGTIHQYSDNTITASESLLSASILGVVLVVALIAMRPAFATKHSSATITTGN